ncbi:MULTISPECIES: hypothetical protein [unclassified Erythrobacter]|uniref:hypothetical protein n=1 Tax=unclassified Erythrobacter TaxID=2633097 RepID=UPI0012E95F15|nr:MULTISPECIES: hypothetical protein [unclassified Erythrobacter]
MNYPDWLAVWDRAAVSITTALCVFLMGSGLLMVLDPSGWHQSGPGLAAQGGFNPYLIRSVGAANALAATLLDRGLTRPSKRPALWRLASSWLCARAIVHFIEVSSPAHAFEVATTDAVGVYLPAMMSMVLWKLGTASPRHLHDGD